MKKQLLFTTTLLTLAAALLAAWALNARENTGERSEKPLEESPAEHAPIRARVIYERPDGVYVNAWGEKQGQKLVGGGTYPRWSPDGKHIAFLKGHQLIHANADGTAPSVLTDIKTPRALNYHANGKEVLFTDGKHVRSVDLVSGKVTTVLEGRQFLELDVTADGRRLAATVKGVAGLGFGVRAFDLVTGVDRSMGAGCSASISPNGRLVSNLLKDHKQLALRDWDSGETVSTVDAPPGLRFDNQFWSNHPDWIVSQSEGEQSDIYAHMVSANRAFQLTFSGDCQRADLYVEEHP